MQRTLKRAMSTGKEGHKVDVSHLRKDGHTAHKRARLIAIDCVKKFAIPRDTKYTCKSERNSARRQKQNRSSKELQVTKRAWMNRVDIVDTQGEISGFDTELKGAEKSVGLLVGILLG